MRESKRHRDRFFLKVSKREKRSLKSQIKRQERVKRQKKEIDEKKIIYLKF